MIIATPATSQMIPTVPNALTYTIQLGLERMKNGGSSRIGTCDRKREEIIQDQWYCPKRNVVVNKNNVVRFVVNSIIKERKQTW